MSDLISRQAATDELIAMREHIESRMSVVGTTAYEMAIEALREPEIIHCKDCKHHWVHRCMDSIQTEICDLNQTFYDADFDFCSLAERRTDEGFD